MYPKYVPTKLLPSTNVQRWDVPYYLSKALADPVNGVISVPSMYFRCPPPVTL